MKKCVACAEEIQDEAKVCKFCNREQRQRFSLTRTHLSYGKSICWILGIIFGLIGIANLATNAISGTAYLIAAALVLPPITDSLKKKNFSVPKPIKTILVIILLIFGGANSSPKSAGTSAIKQEARPIAETVQPMIETERSRQAKAVFDVPSLVGKNIDQIKKIHGTPSSDTEPTKLQMEMGADQWDKTFKRNGKELLVTYNPKTREVIDFFIIADDPSGTTQDRAYLLKLGNLDANSSTYRIEFVASRKYPAVYTGVKIIPNE